MKKLSLKHFSFLGLALIGVSAVTAAILPSNKEEDDSYRLKGGTIVPSSDGASVTCAAKAAADSCFATLNSGTTGGNPETSEGTTFPDNA